MNSMLPLGKKWLGLERTLETVSTAIYVPFTTQELFQPGGLYEGINARSKNLILCNRKLLPAPAGMVLGMTGYGKSFSVMQMVTNIMLRWQMMILSHRPGAGVHASRYSHGWRSD